MLPNMKTAAVSALAALSIALGAAAPAQALGKNERNFLKGVAAAALVGALINENRKDRAQAQEVPSYNPPPRHNQNWNNGRHNDRHDNRYYNNGRYDQGHYSNNRPTGRVVGQPQTSSSVYSTIAAQSFNSYSPSQRRQIQQRLQNYGYYRGGVDGAFGPGTYSAIVAYSRDAGGSRQLDTRAGAFGVYDSLIY